jgi:hypothetical protein
VRYGWAICTRNDEDFEDEHEKAQARGQQHCGVLVVGKQWMHRDIYWALRQYLEQLRAGTLPDPRNQVVELPLATREFLQEHAGEKPPVQATLVRSCDAILSVRRRASYFSVAAVTACSIVSPRPSAHAAANASSPSAARTAAMWRS